MFHALVYVLGVNLLSILFNLLHLEMACVLLSDLRKHLVDLGLNYLPLQFLALSPAMKSRLRLLRYSMKRSGDAYKLMNSSSIRSSTAESALW